MLKKGCVAMWQDVSNVNKAITDVGGLTIGVIHKSGDVAYYTYDASTMTFRDFKMDIIEYVDMHEDVIALFACTNIKSRPFLITDIDNTLKGYVGTCWDDISIEMSVGKDTSEILYRIINNVIKVKSDT